MGQLRSTGDVSDVIIDGVTLGEPAIDDITGENVWDHPSIPDGDIVANDWATF